MTNTENIRPGIVDRVIKEFGIRSLVRQEERGRVARRIAGKFGGDAIQYLYLLVPNEVKLRQSDKVGVSSIQGAFMGHIVGYNGREAHFIPEEVLVDSYTHGQVQQRLEEVKQKNKSK